MTIRWMDQEYTEAHDYYREVVLSMPKEDGVILGAKEHLSALCNLSDMGVYVSDPSPDDIYVDSWRVNGSYVTHRHSEFGLIETNWTTGVIECDLRDGKCDLCHKEISGEIQMMHNFYRLDN